MQRLTRETLDRIRGDNDLARLVADKLNVRFTTLPALLTKNGRRLTEYKVLKLISDCIRKPIDELIEEYDEHSRSTVDNNKLQNISKKKKQLVKSH
jgi:hypothetical protein